MYDLAIVVPSIRQNKIKRVYDSVKDSIGDFTYKFIVCGNYDSTEVIPESFSMVSYASPNYCVQKAIVELTEDCKYVKWSTDDAIYFDSSLANLLSGIGEKNFGVVKYTEEGPPGYPDGSHDIYYTAHTHNDLRVLPGVKPWYNIAPVSLYKRSDFIELGGLDCRYEHINLSTHDLAFRAQEYGLSAYISKDVVMHCDSNSSDPSHRALDVAHFHNDYPIFSNKYQNFIGVWDIKINESNYKDAPEVWRRFQ